MENKDTVTIRIEPHAAFTIDNDGQRPATFDKIIEAIDRLDVLIAEIREHSNG
jgi:hypothetical protein